VSVRKYAILEDVAGMFPAGASQLPDCVTG